ncbi:MAG: hypothetical protein ACR2O5_10405 [Thiogranum sp.]
MEPAIKPVASALLEGFGRSRDVTVILAAKQIGGHIMLAIGDGGTGMAPVKTRSGPE